MTIHTTVAAAIGNAEARKMGRTYLGYAFHLAAGLRDEVRRFEILLDQQKTAVTPGAITDDAISPLTPFSAGIIELLRGRSAVAAMLSSFRNVPPRIKIPRQTTGTVASFVGEQQVATITSAVFDSVTLETRKLKSAVVISKELAMRSTPAAFTVFQNDLLGAIGFALDDAFLNPAYSETQDRPAAVTQGASTLASSGSTAAAASNDIHDLIVLAGGEMLAPYLVMKPRTAVALAQLGIPFLNVGWNGGNIFGVPVVCTTNAPVSPSSPGADTITYVDAAEILMSLGDIEFGTLTQAMLQMSDAPDSPPTASTAMISLWQQYLVGVTARHAAVWKRAHTTGVATLTGLEL
jgi:HK97 family phage major capsid protein